MAGLKINLTLSKALADMIKSGDATAADLSRQFLKDNHIDSIPKPDNPLGQLADQLPFPDTDGVLEETLDIAKH